MCKGVLNRKAFLLYALINYEPSISLFKVFFLKSFQIVFEKLLQNLEANLGKAGTIFFVVVLFCFYIS